MTTFEKFSGRQIVFGQRLGREPAPDSDDAATTNGRRAADAPPTLRRRAADETPTPGNVSAGRAG